MRNIVESLLVSRWLWLVARVLLAIVFVSSGLAKLIDFEGGMAEMRGAGLSPAWFFNVVTIITLLGGSLLLLLDRAVWLGAGALAVFLILTIVIVHHFWAMPEEQMMMSLYVALEHISVIGGLIAVSIASELHKRYSQLRRSALN